MIPTNEKLRARAVSMICEITGMDVETAKKLLERHARNIRSALKGE